MQENSQGLRHAAAEAFVESLSQLEQRLLSPGDEAANGASPPHSTTPATVSASKSAAVGDRIQQFAEAVADIEQYIQTQQPDVKPR